MLAPSPTGAAVETPAVGGGPRDRDPESGFAAALLWLALALAGFLLLPPLIGFLPWSLPGVPGFTLQEATDLLTPIAVLPLAWLALDRAGGFGRRGLVAFLVLGAAWASAQGIHLAANAVTDAFPDAIWKAKFTATTPGHLDDWLDETLSHWEWHVAWAGILAVLVLATVADRGRAALGRRTGLVAGLGGAIHGFTWFTVTTEGGTWALGMPVAFVLGAWAVLGGTSGGRRRVLAIFAGVSALLSLLLWVGWVAMCGWYPASIFGFITTGGCVVE